jgi:carboxypeptidase Taq
VHPFTTSFSINDVRITTRVDRNFLSPALFGTLHETGHAMYEQGFSQSLERTPLADGASLGMHESQSRMWENLVGRSLPFWKFFFPILKGFFPEQLADQTVESFHRAANKVSPSFIRVEADEVTYGLHIMLRFEMENDLLEGRLKPDEVPEASNAKMQEFLGITPPTTKDGALQDIHWSSGLIGYFPTYQLGNRSRCNCGIRSTPTYPISPVRSNVASSRRCWAGCARICINTGVSSHPTNCCNVSRAAA